MNKTELVAAVAEETGKSKATGKEIKIPASRQPKFVAGKMFKDALNGK